MHGMETEEFGAAMRHLPIDRKQIQYWPLSNSLISLSRQALSEATLAELGGVNPLLF